MIAVATPIEKRFVELAKKYKNEWQGSKLKLWEDEIAVLFEVVTAAGFNPKEVVSGQLLGRYRDNDGYTGETFVINTHCPFKVLGQGDNGPYEHYHATGWLNEAIRRVLIGGISQSAIRAVYGNLPEGKGEPIEEAVEAIRLEIKRSIPLWPIQLTSEGDILEEYPLSVDRGYFVDHARDTNEFSSSCVGIHKFCNGYVDRNRATETHDAIRCRQCGVRVLFPKEVKTYGDLRSYFASKGITQRGTT